MKKHITAKIKHFKESVRKVLAAHVTPHEVASGVAIGAFISVLPLYGIHILLALLFVLLIPKTNKLAILAGANLTSVPTFPFVLWLEYKIGRGILGSNGAPMTMEMLKRHDYRELAHLLAPIFLGSAIFGLFLAGVFYFLTKFFIGLYRRRLKAQGR